jgi:hypothetical protein
LVRHADSNATSKVKKKARSQKVAKRGSMRVPSEEESKKESSLQLTAAKIAEGALPELT